MYRLISIDASTVSTGVAVYKVTKKGYKLEDYRLITDKRKRPNSSKLSKAKKKELQHKITYERILFMINEIRNILNKYKPEKIIVEDIYGGKDLYAFKMLSRFHGAILEYSLTHNAKILYKMPNGWRADLGIPIKKGKVWLKREQLKKMSIQKVKDVFNINVNDDLADAICIGLSELQK